jgi:hypothetical protein
MTLTITVDVDDDQADDVAATWPAATWPEVIAAALTLALDAHATTTTPTAAARQTDARQDVADLAAAFGRAA